MVKNEDLEDKAKVLEILKEVPLVLWSTSERKGHYCRTHSFSSNYNGWRLAARVTHSPSGCGWGSDSHRDAQVIISKDEEEYHLDFDGYGHELYNLFVSIEYRQREVRLARELSEAIGEKKSAARRSKEGLRTFLGDLKD
jgi:hypothetical protein